MYGKYIWFMIWIFLEFISAEINIEDYFIRNEYQIETHSVTTEDGYILGVQRVSKGEPNSNFDPIILMHGLLTSADNWIFLEANKSLPCLLANKGYDVWMPNARGTIYSDEHTSLKKSDDDFWKFSWHEIGKFDIPAVIDHILKTTNKQKVAYVGHSQGTTVFFVMGSERPEYQPKVSVGIMLAPSVFLEHTKSFALTRFAHLYRLIDDFMHMMNFYEFKVGFDDETIRQTFGFICNSDTWKHICTYLISMFLGPESDNFNQNLIPRILSSIPAGQSTMQIIHYSQCIATGEFKQYDFGPEKNMEKYNSTTPPKYNLNISTPIALFYSKDDRVNDKIDILHLAKLLPNLIDKYEVPYPNWTHLDFLVANNVATMIYHRVIKLIGQYANEK